MKNSFYNISHNLIYVKVFTDGGLCCYNIFSFREKYLLIIQKSIINSCLKAEVVNRQKRFDKPVVNKKPDFRY